MTLDPISAWILRVGFTVLGRRTLVRLPGAVPARVRAGPGDGHHHHGPVLLWYHAAMMAAMVWMAVLMSMVGTVSLPGWSIAPSVGFVLLLAVAALWFLVRLVRVPAGDLRAHPVLPPVIDTLLSFAMAILMGAGFLLML